MYRNWQQEFQMFVSSWLKHLYIETCYKPVMYKIEPLLNKITSFYAKLRNFAM